MNQAAVAVDQIDEAFMEWRRLVRGNKQHSSRIRTGASEGAIVEERLRQSEERYRNLVESARDIILTISADGVITSLNPAFEAITGRQRKDCIGKPLISLLDPKDEHRGREMLERVLKGEMAPLFELHMQSSHGEDLTVEFTASPHLIDGRVEGLFGIVRDVTEGKAAREECNRLATVVREVGEGIVITDCDGLIEYVNPAFERTTGYERAEIVGCHYNILSNIPQNREEGTCPDLAKWESVIQSGVLDIQRTHKKKDGTLYDVRTTISPIRDTAGRIVNYALIERDITRVLKLEKQLRQAQKMEAIGTLSGGIAHDFNNILVPITGYAELAICDIEEGKMPELNQLEELFKAAQRAKNLVKQILSFSRQAEQETQPVRVSAIIEESIGLLRASLPSTIEIQQDVATKSKVLGDPTQIQQVIMNLCTNASHAMRNTGGTLRISLCEIHLDSKDTGQYPGLQPGSYLRLVVNDTGHGIEPCIIEKVFDPFFTTKGPREGTGLGLAVVHGIVKSHGGIITVKSDSGKGATFKILLPRIDEAEESENIEVKPIPMGDERILYVDDEPSIAQWAKKMLERLGYEVVSKTNSFEALEAFRAAHREERFNMVITDMTMPGMTGIDLAGELMHLQPGIPIILCTGGAGEMITPEKAGQLGIRAFLMKPLMRRELAETIRRVLDAA